jgi:hypothetical protein
MGKSPLSPIGFGGAIGTKGNTFSINTVRMAAHDMLEATMFELIKSLAFAVIMVPVVMAVILGLIYGLGEVFNILSAVGHRDGSSKQKNA